MISFHGPFALHTQAPPDPTQLSEIPLEPYV
jgi:hypothetical protein